MKRCPFLLALLIFISPVASAQDSSQEVDTAVQKAEEGNAPKNESVSSESVVTELPGSVAEKLVAVEALLDGLENSIKKIDAGEFSGASADDFLRLKVMIENSYDTLTPETYLQFAKKHGLPSDDYESFAQNARIKSLMGLVRKFDVSEDHPEVAKVTARYNDLMAKFYEQEKKATQ